MYSEDEDIVAQNKAWAIERRKFVDTLRRGDVVVAQQDLDPEGANVKTGDLGVVFEESNAYSDEGGPMVRWTRAKEGGGVDSGGMCNVYDGDVIRW